jgi:2-polyprenyl-3-methyl-5-hydroxy-6-metoxy-1,4-benzoquinol methylase
MKKALMTLAASAKKAVLFRLGQRGVAVVRTERRTKTDPIRYTDAELEQLDRDIAALPLNTTDFKIWTNGAAVRSYLVNERINFYHQLVSATESLGVELAGRSVLDVGTCSGYLLRVVLQSHPDAKVSGTDYYEECVRLSAALVPTANVFQASIDDLKTTSETYDAVYCTEVLEHILDTESQIPALLELVKPGGALIVTVPNGRYDATPCLTSEDGISYGGHVNFWSKESWGYYIDRMAGSQRTEKGTLTSHFDEDALFAVIFKDAA